jgi:hypothetical protein
MKWSCGKCDSTWGGFSTAHCSSCNLTFGSVRSFDLHRSKGKCLNPALVHIGVGGIDTPGPFMRLGKLGYWGFAFPGSEE